MKKQTTKNSIKRNYNNIINVGYTNLNHLFYYDDNNKYYNCGVYGWNWNAYELDANTCIISGYRNTVGSDIDHDYIVKIDNKAKEIIKNYTKYEDQIKHLEDLKAEFLNNYKNYILK